MILIGDSIAEGHPDLHGRLHADAGGTIDLAREDQPGQLGYELAKRLDMRVVNQGIGSQSSVDVRKRWARDVFGETSDPGDGRGSRTLETADVRPTAVYVHVGINDFSLKVPAEQMRGNFIFFAESCRKLNVSLIVSNVGAESDTRWFTPAVRKAVSQFNEWLSSDFKTLHPEVCVVDYRAWSTGNTGDLTTLKPGMFADNIHPNRAGYADFAEFAAERIRPVLKSAAARVPPSTRPSR